MEETVLHIKNMVCPRCMLSVEEILTRLGLTYSEVSLGEVRLQVPLEPEMREKLSLELEKVGFELVEERNQKISNRIKAIIIEQVYSEEASVSGNLSDILSEKLNYDYSHLTSIFRQTEGQSIQNFQNKIRLERIKELLEYDEMNISEIADAMGFGSAAYLSTFFKKGTGMNPSQYKMQQDRNRKSIDSV